MSTANLISRRPILVVDDEPDILRSLKSLLRHEFQVYTAGGGEEAMRVLEENEIHVVMTDQRMPRMNGVEVLRRVKATHPEAMRVIFTGYADVQAVIDAVNQGNVFRYVAKPWDPDDLIASLKEAGEAYDWLTNRERLLADLRAHEEQCVALDDIMDPNRIEGLEPATANRLQELFTQGRALLSRLSRALALPRKPS